MDEPNIDQLRTQLSMLENRFNSIEKLIKKDTPTQLKGLITQYNIEKLIEDDLPKQIEDIRKQSRWSFFSLFAVIMYIAFKVYFS